jgi:phosphoribosylaminoimidazolecarboxamide formyltransferase/IMP cyclohydrolase
MISRALLSVSDKAGITELARGLTELGVEVVSSGGTAAALAKAGVAVTLVSEVTGFQEILGGRLKTLHPKIHGGILADRENPEHLAELAQQGIEPIDLVVCNLYPFEHAVAHPSVKERDAIEQIDIGGPAMVRAAAKNFHSVAVVVRPADYERILEELREHGAISLERRRSLALQAFAHTASYDSAIAAYLGRGVPFPDRLLLVADKVMDLRYGENPHQSAALYRSAGPATGLAAASQLHGKELSYNNLLDADAAWKLVIELDGIGCAIIKHSNPCGAALGESIEEAYSKALECDRTSAFGGIVALNRPCDAATADRIIEIFTEVVVAPNFEDGALQILSAKKNLRVLRADGRLEPELDIRRVSGGVLLQSPDRSEGGEGDGGKVVTETEPTSEQWTDLTFAWTVAKHVKSNAIVLAKDGAAVGVGAGQMSRVESTELAARRAGGRARGTVCASDAYFPFRDGLDAAVSAGAVAVIQPGGSIRDEEVIAAANEHGIPMVFTGKRHFRH